MGVSARNLGSLVSLDRKFLSCACSFRISSYCLSDLVRTTYGDISILNVVVWRTLFDYVLLCGLRCYKSYFYHMCGIHHHHAPFD